MDLNDIVAISAVRTPMGKFGGTLKDIPAYDLGAVAVKEAINRASISSDQVDDVILGSCRCCSIYVQRNGSPYYRRSYKSRRWTVYLMYELRFTNYDLILNYM